VIGSGSCPQANLLYALFLANFYQSKILIPGQLTSHHQFLVLDSSAQMPHEPSRCSTGFEIEGNSSTSVCSLGNGLLIVAMYVLRVGGLLVAAPCRKRNNKIMSVVYRDVVEPNER